MKEKKVAVKIELAKSWFELAAIFGTMAAFLMVALSILIDVGDDHYQDILEEKKDFYDLALLNQSNPVIQEAMQSLAIVMGREEKLISQANFWSKVSLIAVIISIIMALTSFLIGHFKLKGIHRTI